MAIGFSAHLQPPPESDIRAYIAGVLHPSKHFDVRTSLPLIPCEGLIHGPGRRMHFDHHLCHAASTVIPSGFDRANFISLDGWGGASSGLLGRVGR
jgi:predicted NodU family carbamoyl transferase